MTTEEPVAPAAAAATAPSQGAKGKDMPASQKDAQQQHEQAATADTSAAPASSAQQNGAEGEEEEEDPDLPCRVYAGNLSFSTNEDELKAAFAKFGAIKAVTIVRYNTRHMGFGFVTYEQEADATKAIAEMNKTTLQEREISVQSARSKAESRRRRALRKQRNTRRKKTAKKQTSDDKDAQSPGADESSGQEQKEGDATGEKATGKGTKGRARKAGPRPERPKPVRGPPSTTTVFVGNLPFSLKDEDFEKAFKDEGLSVASAYIVRGRGRMAHRSKGFGFVELSDETNQKKAVDVMHGKKLEERTISVRVALERVANGEVEGEGQEDANGVEAQVKTEQAQA